MAFSRRSVGGKQITPTACTEKRIHKGCTEAQKKAVSCLPCLQATSGVTFSSGTASTKVWPHAAQRLSLLDSFSILHLNTKTPLACQQGRMLQLNGATLETRAQGRRREGGRHCADRAIAREKAETSGYHHHSKAQQTSGENERSRTEGHEEQEGKKTGKEAGSKQKDGKEKESPTDIPRKSDAGVR